jgi:hypothetical protein
MGTKIKAKRVKSLKRYAKQCPDEISDLIFSLLKNQNMMFESNYHKLKLDAKRFLGILLVVIGRRILKKVVPYLYDEEIEELKKIISLLGNEAINEKEINFVVTEAMKLLKHRKYRMRGGEKKSIILLKDDVEVGEIDV